MLEEGMCVKGSECHFAHSEPEKLAGRKADPKFKTVLCKFHFSASLWTRFASVVPPVLCVLKSARCGGVWLALPTNPQELVATCSSAACSTRVLTLGAGPDDVEEAQRWSIRGVIRPMPGGAGGA